MPHRNGGASVLRLLVMIHGLGSVRFCFSVVTMPTQTGGIAAAAAAAAGGVATGAAAVTAAMTVGHVGAGASAGGSGEHGSGGGGGGSACTAVAVAPEPRLPDGRHGSLPANPLLTCDDRTERNTAKENEHTQR